MRDIPATTCLYDAALIEPPTGSKRLQLHFLPEDIVIDYSIDWLLQHYYDRLEPVIAGWVKDDLTLWRSKDMEELPDAKFDQIQRDAVARLHWLENVVRFGFGKLTAAPIADGALYQVIDMFGYIRETNYGRHFEVRVEEEPTNLAFTGASTQAHTDNPYRDPVPSMQLLYCLESSAQGAR